MTFWLLLWKACLIAGMVAFAGMALLVTVGGARDIRRMLKSLRDEE